MKKKFWTSAKLLSLSALFVSLATLFVFVYQTNLIRKQQYMSVYPHLNMGNHNSESLNYKFVLKNEGVGPAFIKSVEIEHLDGSVYESFVDYLDERITEKDSVYFHYSDLYEGQLISANEELILFGLSDKSYTKAHGLPENTIRGGNKLRAMLNTDSLSYKITYESIYEEAWTLVNDSEIPVKN